MMYGRGYNGFGNCFGSDFGFMYSGWGMIMMVAFTILTAIVVIYLVKRLGRRQSFNEASEVLKTRFAKGEISEEEYLKRKNILDL